MTVRRGCIVAKIVPGSEDAVARIFAESDDTELPGLAGVRHRSLFVLDDLYVHYVEMDADVADSVDAVRDHALFEEVSRRLDPYIAPYDPETWRSPKDAQAREFYRWDAPGATDQDVTNSP
jgi:cyclase